MLSRESVESVRPTTLFSGMPLALMSVPKATIASPVRRGLQNATHDNVGVSLPTGNDDGYEQRLISSFALLHNLVEELNKSPVISPRNMAMLIDTSFDFRSDASGKDPDASSPTLRLYHKLLWSKALPSGRLFDLDDTVRGVYLFPGNRIDGKQTINGARGCITKIADRLDLTLECIRRHYLGLGSPLGETLERYGDFFALFGNFEGYVDFFILQDLVTDDYSAVRFFTPFDNFNTSSMPKDGETYKEYRRLSIEFIKARNCRIDL